MKKYGFFGGSFNPVTNAHIELARKIVKNFLLDKVVFVPVGNNYVKPGLVSENDRFNMLKIGTLEYEELEVSNIELNQAKNLTTLEAFEKIEEQYRDIDKYYIVGADNLIKIALSKDAISLAKNYKYIVINRNDIACDEIINNNEILKKYKNNFMIIENVEHRNTSSTNFRKDVKNNAEMLPKNVYEYIKKNELYK